MKRLLFLFIALSLFLTSFSQEQKKYKELTITSGGTGTINLQEYNNYIMISGTSVNLASYYSIAVTGTGTKGMTVTMYSKATGTTGLGIKVFAIDTLTLLDINSQSQITMLCTASGTPGTWQMRVARNFNMDNIVTAANYASSTTAGNGISVAAGVYSINADTTTGLGFSGTSPTKKARIRVDNTSISVTASNLEVKTHGIDSTKILYGAVKTANLPNMTRGTVRVGNSASRPTDLAAGGSGSLLIGSGTDIVSAAVQLGAIQPVLKTPGNTIWWQITNDSILSRYLNDTLRSELLVVPLSFDTLQSGDTIFVRCPYNAQITRITYSTTKTMMTTWGCLTTKPSINIFVQPNVSTGIGAACFSVTPAVTPVGVQPTVTTVSSNNIVGKGTYIRLIGNRASPCKSQGGSVLLSITLKRIY